MYMYVHVVLLAVSLSSLYGRYLWSYAASLRILQYIVLLAIGLIAAPGAGLLFMAAILSSPFC